MGRIRPQGREGRNGRGNGLEYRGGDGNGAADGAGNRSGDRSGDGNWSDSGKRSRRGRQIEKPQYDGRSRVEEAREGATPPGNQQHQP